MHPRGVPKGVLQGAERHLRGVLRTAPEEGHKGETWEGHQGEKRLGHPRRVTRSSPRFHPRESSGGYPKGPRKRATRGNQGRLLGSTQRRSLGKTQGRSLGAPKGGQLGWVDHTENQVGSKYKSSLRSKKLHVTLADLLWVIHQGNSSPTYDECNMNLKMNGSWNW